VSNLNYQAFNTLLFVGGNQQQLKRENGLGDTTQWGKTERLNNWSHRLA